ncbi:MAG: hypothetical protein WAO55_15655 [Candidatus Manganitrophaceae bacterium]
MPTSNHSLQVTGRSPPDQVKELRRRLDLIQSTDMALIVSPGQNEIAQMRVSMVRGNRVQFFDVTVTGRPAA